MNVPDQKFWDVNVNGTRNMLEASIATGVKRFIYGSTIGVYGSLEGRIDENSPCQPDNIYGVTKLAAEKLALSYQDRISVVAVRISETYGPGDRRLLKLFKGIRKNVPFLIGDGQNVHHLVYIDDLIQGFLLAATVDAACGKVFVLAGKEPVTTGEMFTVIAEQLGAKAPTVRIPLTPLLVTATAMETLLRPLGVQPPLHRRRMDFFKKSFSFSLDKGETILGYRPQVDFRRGVLETASWYKQQGYLS
jgi:nucleoside-diphosphate-sugar epimerase